MHGREDLWGPFERTMAFCRANLIDPEFGGWYLDRSLDKGSEWKVDYHVVGLCEEAIRLAGLLEEDT
jgi:mannose/cellobiose epimerase-like protein (N-acyl-D-glucosamine 2-epimerase family)